MSVNHQKRVKWPWVSKLGQQTIKYGDSTPWAVYINSIGVNPKHHLFQPSTEINMKLVRKLNIYCFHNISYLKGKNSDFYS